MGAYTANGIQKFEPDNTETTLYLKSDMDLSFSDILERAQDYFGEVSMVDLTITAEHIHTNCIGYDRYDPWDHTNYIVINKNAPNIDGI